MFEFTHVNVITRSSSVEEAELARLGSEFGLTRLMWLKKAEIEIELDGMGFQMLTGRVLECVLWLPREGRLTRWDMSGT